MITEFILNIVFNIAISFFNVLPPISWDLDTTWFDYVRNILAIVGYFLPMEHVVTIITLIQVIIGFRIAVALGKTIWDLLPFV